ncbi:MAG: YdjY domain-containing protein [Chthoniobacteraceae bacterium]
MLLVVPALLGVQGVRAQERSVMKEIGPGVFQLGALRLDKNARSVSFSGRLNQAKDFVEYVLVTPMGPTHESLLTSEIQPSDLHFAMLLLGAKGAGLLAPQPGDAPPAQIDADYLRKAPRLKGDNVTFSVKWKDKAGVEQTAPVEDWLMNEKTRRAAPRGPWIYSGSMFGQDGGFLAQQQGLFASVITNPGALINNPRRGNDDDKAWAVNEKAVPPVDTPVEIIITLSEGTSETK